MRSVLFDLDGTLFDSREVAVLAAQRAVAELPGDVPIPSPERVLATVGAPPDDHYAALLPPEHAARAGELRERAGRHELQLLREGAGRLFPGARETLEALRARGLLLGIVTNSEREFAQAVLQSQGLDRLVHVAFCATDQPGGGKAALVAATLKELQKPAVLAGDRRSDLEAARAHGLATVGCLWGYGGAEELGEANRLAGDWAELRHILEEWHG